MTASETTAVGGARRASAKERVAGTLRRVRRTLARLPTAIWLCALIAIGNAVCWSAITPLYWVPDEVGHSGYVQYLAGTGKLPTQSIAIGQPMIVSPEQAFLYEGLPWGQVGRPSWIEANAKRLQAGLRKRPLARTRPTQALFVAGYPPLYYAYEAIPDRVASDAPLTNRIMLMRVWSALLIGLTVAFIALFVRELFPRQPWLWTVAGLTVAFQPVLGFMAGGINNDNLLYATSAALFFFLARAFRRGLTPARGAALGLAAAAGMLTKPTTVALLPGMAIGVAALVWRARAAGRFRSAGAGAGLAVGLAALPYASHYLFGGSWIGRSGGQTSGVVSSAASDGATLSGLASYVWQALLPKLPFLQDQIPWYVPWEIYFKGGIGGGRFGWFEYGFTHGWYLLSAAIFVALTLLAARALFQHRAVLRRRWTEVVTYLAMAGGLVFAVEIAAYRYHVDLPAQYFEQGRYLFPLLALYGAFVALAALGAGRRFGRPVGALIVVLAIGVSLGAQLLTIGRFYA